MYNTTDKLDAACLQRSRAAYALQILRQMSNPDPLLVLQAREDCIRDEIRCCALRLAEIESMRRELLNERGVEQ